MDGIDKGPVVQLMQRLVVNVGGQGLGDVETVALGFALLAEMLCVRVSTEPVPGPWLAEKNTVE